MKFLDLLKPGDMVYTPFYDKEHPEESVVLGLRITGIGFEGFTVSTSGDYDAMDAVVPWSGYMTDWFLNQDAAEEELAQLRGKEFDDGWV